MRSPLRLWAATLAAVVVAALLSLPSPAAAQTTPEITIAAGTSSVTEGTAASFTLTRTGSTTAALTVNVSVSESGDMVAAANEGANTATFEANSATAALSVATAGDSVDEADSVVTATVTADTATPVTYTAGTPASATVTVRDNDLPEINISRSTSATVAEGTTLTFNLSRTWAAPARLVVRVTVEEIAHDVNTPGDMIAAANEGSGSVTFQANSATATLSVPTVDDAEPEINSQVEAEIEANASSYRIGRPNRALVIVRDNDVRGVTISTSRLTVDEGATGIYTVRLNTRPTGRVTVTPLLATESSSDVTFSPTSLKFRRNRWNTLQTVTVTAANDSDALVDRATITHAVTGADYATHDVSAASVTVTVRDDEGDTTAPALASAAANGASLVITFDEILAAAANLANSAFTVKKTSGGVEATVTLSTTIAPAISGKTVTLTLGTALVSTDGSVKVSYTEPTTGTANKLVDAAANETASFTDQTVTNNTPAANAAPTASNGEVTATEDTDYTFTAANFSFSDTDTDDTLSSVKITSLPAAVMGTLEVDGTAISSTDLLKTVTKADIDADKLKYSPPANANGDDYATFMFKVNDGTVDSAAAYTMTIDVTAVNDAPTASNSTVTTNEDTDYTFTAADFNFSDVDTDDSLQVVTISKLPADGKGTLYLDTTQISSVPRYVAIESIVGGKLKYRPSANANGAGFATFKFEVEDLLVTSAEYTMTINVTAVNDDPAVTVSFGASTYTAAEGGTATVTVTLSADPERTVVIPVTKTNQGGASAGDYSGVPADVTFDAGDTEKTITFSATQDTEDDDDESVKLGFGSTLPARVSAGTTDETTVSITDDDDPAVTVSFGAATLAAPVVVPPPNKKEPETAREPATSRAAEETCSGGGYNPTPTAVEVTDVPIVVTSTTADYFVLYVSHDVDGTEVESPVLVKKGAAGTTTLAENVEALPAERYRVEKYLTSDPADVDGDCIDDITELDDFGTMNPVNSAGSVKIIDGVVGIPDQATFEAIVLSGRYTKFVVFDLGSESQRVYFQNANTHPSHQTFLDVLRDKGIEEHVAPGVRGFIDYHPDIVAANGSPGVYAMWDYRSYPFNIMDLVYTMIAASMPLVDQDLAVYLRNFQLLNYQEFLPLFDDSRIHVIFAKDINAEKTFVPLNEAVGYGLLRVLEADERPHSRDVVIYEALPNDLPRVAGIISTVPQTPLSHVNLRAVQSGVPNSYIRDALDKSRIDRLTGSYVRYEVTLIGWDLRAATKAEVDAHYASSRPATSQTLLRDLSVRTITPLSEIGFDNWDAFGVKAANVAELQTLSFPEGTIPDGYAIPFYFYDEFMKHNNFYTRIQTMLDDEEFQTDFDTQEAELKKLRKDIEDAETPQWIIEAIETMNEGFTEGINRRYRSSTNNEDLPGFNGAGLYDSKSQKPSEDEDDLAKSLKEVYASLWNFRAFVEREFHRIDHLSAAMGILVHPSYQDEFVNGVAVSFDPVYDLDRTYYVNSQVGEDLVTNPDELSSPEELLLTDGGAPLIQEIFATSNQVPRGQLLMSGSKLRQLRRHLTVIHDHFKGLYKPATGDPFAMEIEFKITSENILAIKQARPWVFGPAPASDAAGTVALSPTQHRVGSPVTATLTDPDGGETNVTWNWERSSNQIAWTSISRADSAAYTPVAGDVGNYLRATARYTDRHGPGKNASAVSSNPVRPAATNQVPAFTEGASTTRSVSENTAAGASIGLPVRATDPNGDRLTYSLSGTDAASFGIVASSGQLQTRSALNYEAKNSYALTMSVRDGKDTLGNADSRTDDTIRVSINVTDVNEVPVRTVRRSRGGGGGGGGGGGFVPSQPPAFITGARTPITITGNLPSGANVGRPVAARDATNYGLTYSLGGPDAAFFTIDESSGQIKVAPGPTLDYGAGRHTYTVEVTARNIFGSTATTRVTITVTSAVLGRLGSKYDADHNEVIDRDEVLAAIADYFNGRISLEDVLELVKLYFAS